MPNRLASEQSPYLLQHQDNPVEWYAWDDEAFARARAEDKPIFLSVGYSTCHWCHVMAHESFESADVAAVLNESFVSIKVDREERPDVDRVYMTFVQATTGSGGWPMSVWLTPDLRPFYGGTYYPPTSRWGRPGFVDVLREIARTWREERDKVEYSALTILDRLRAIHAADGHGGIPEPSALDRGVDELAAAFDRRRGGFGGAPKFPRPSELLFLLREHARTGRAEPREMAVHTLRAMALGGMRDHLGGGFHRYSVDAEWRVPHFEKMLYDQAQLVLAYLEAAQATGDAGHLDVAADTLAYVRRDLTDEGGAFFSAEDADSVPPEDAHDPHAHRMEGAFYIWRDDEVGTVLGPDADLVRERYGIQRDGNAPFDPQGEFVHKNLLYTARSLTEVAERLGRPVAEVEAGLARARLQLLEARSRRPRPHLDDKVLAAWNGLMIAAFARAARVVPDGEAYLASATRAADFVQRWLWKAGDGTLLRRYRRGTAGVAAYAEDYAFLTHGMLELFQASGDPRWLEWAFELARQLDARFWDAEGGGWFSTTGDDPSVLLRVKEQYDGAEPSASSVAVANLLVLATLTDVPAQAAAMVEKVERTLGMFAPHLGRSVPAMLSALSTYHAGTVQVVVAGERGGADTQALAGVLRGVYTPTAVVIPVFPDHRAGLDAALPWIAPMTMRDGRATAYVCRNFVCDVPATSPEALAAQLRSGGRP